jgi:hypothetical protein
MRTAIVVVVVALVTVGSTSAAYKVIITSKDIKNGTIQPIDLSAKAKRTLRGTRGQNGEVGPPGAQGIQGPPGIQNVTIVTTSVSVPSISLRYGFSPCPAGQNPISGGFSFPGMVWGSYKHGSGWETAVFNDSNSTYTLYTFAHCSPNVTNVGGFGIQGEPAAPDVKAFEKRAAALAAAVSTR